MRKIEAARQVRASERMPPLAFIEARSLGEDY